MQPKTFVSRIGNTEKIWDERRWYVTVLFVKLQKFCPLFLKHCHHFSTLLAVRHLIL